MYPRFAFLLPVICGLSENKPNLKLDGPKFEPGEEFEVMLCSSLQRNGTFSVSPMFRDDSIITLNQLGVEIRSVRCETLSHLVNYVLL